MDQTVLDANGVKNLASLQSLDELRGKLVDLLGAPATKVAGVLQAPAGQLARVVSAKAHRVMPRKTVKSRIELRKKMADLEKIAEDLSALSVLKRQSCQNFWKKNGAFPPAQIAVVSPAGGTDGVPLKPRTALPLFWPLQATRKSTSSSSGNHRSRSERGQRDR